MLHYKIERILFVVLWLGMVCLFSMVLVPVPPERISALIQYQYIANSFIVTFLIFFIYHRISKKITINKIKYYMEQTNYKEAIKYVDNCQKKRPDLFWLQVQKLGLLALDGNICGYQMLKKQIEVCKKASKSKITNMIKMWDNIFLFLQRKRLDTNVIFGKTTMLEKTNYLLCNKDTLPDEQLVVVASEIYNFPHGIFRSIAALVMYEYYLKMGDEYSQKFYQENALDSAPSASVRFCVEKTLEEYIKRV